MKSKLLVARWTTPTCRVVCKRGVGLLPTHRFGLEVAVGGGGGGGGRRRRLWWCAPVDIAVGRWALSEQARPPPRRPAVRASARPGSHGQGVGALSLPVSIGADWRRDGV